MGRANRRRVVSNRLFWAALAGILVWFADQPALAGYNPLFQMFWDPGVLHIPIRGYAVLLLSWVVTTVFCHFVFFTFQRARLRKGSLRIER